MNFWIQSKDNIYVAAHRGLKAKYPENTLESFKKALELGVDQLETDIRMTKDGVLVLIHDYTVDRTTDGTGNVCDFTFEEIRKLDAGGGNKIPTLIEFMELIKDHPTLTVDFEFKIFPKDDEKLACYICDKAIEIIEEYNFGHRSVLNCADGMLLEYILEKYGDKYKIHTYYPCAWRDLSDLYPRAYCACVSGVLDGTVTIDEVKKISQETGMRVWAGPYASNEKAIDVAIQMGAELITCDNPDEVLEILRKKGYHK